MVFLSLPPPSPNPSNLNTVSLLRNPILRERKGKFQQNPNPNCHRLRFTLISPSGEGEKNQTLLF